MISRSEFRKPFHSGVEIEWIAKIMYMYLRKFCVPVAFRKGKKHESIHTNFMKDFFSECENYVMENPVRLRLPLDLGYMQVWKHLYEKKDIRHINKFYGDDFSLVWIVHRMYQHVVMYQCLELKQRLIDFIIRTGNKDYLTDIAVGDHFYLSENKYVSNYSFGGFCEEEKHYTRRIPKKTFKMRGDTYQWKLRL